MQPGIERGQIRDRCAALGPRLIDPRVRRVVIGLGAQKAATTWLHRTLAGHADVHRAPAKELHFWDNLFGLGRADRGELERAKRDRANARWGLLADLPGLRFLAGREVHARRLRAGMYEGGLEDRISSYLRFLQYRYASAPMLMDISPSYALLPADALEAIATLHSDVRFVFLMRDPAERLWSATGMSLKQDDVDMAHAAKIRAELFRAALADPASLNHWKCRYDLTLAEIDKAKVTEQSFFTFYEHLFRPETLQNLSAFLSVDELGVETDLRFNAGRHANATLPDDLRAEAHATFAQTYRAVADRMGHLPANWEARL